MIWGLILAAASAYLSHKGQKKQAKQQKKDAQRQRDAALAELSPERINQLAQQFYGGQMAGFAPSMMSSQQQAKSSMAKRGLTGSGMSEQIQAGIPGQYAGMAMQNAQGQAMNISGQRAGVIGSMPITPSGPSGYDLGAGLLNVGAGYDYLKRQGGEDPWAMFKKKQPTGPTSIK